MDSTEERAGLPPEAPVREVRTERIRIEQHSAVGLLWFAGWLFTIGYLSLGFWRGVLALVVWPYYMGAAFGPPGP